MRPGSRNLLTSLTVCSGALLGLLWLLLQRGPPLASERLSQSADRPRSGAADDLVSGAALQELRPVRVPLVDRPPRAAEVTLPARVAGRLMIDGAPPEGAELTLRSEDGAWMYTAQVARDGSFSVADVPLVKLALSFQLQPSDPRPLLLPCVDLAPRSGEAVELDLDWRTRELNVRVLDAGFPGSNSRVEVEGPHLRASFETNEKGTARLRLVGAGSFSFRTPQPGGRTGRATVEIGADDELISVVIAAEKR